MLTSTEHCGVCDYACAQECVLGSCVIFDMAGSSPLGITTDAQFVYFNANGRVYNQLLGGGDNTDLLEFGGNALWALAVDDSYLYASDITTDLIRIDRTSVGTSELFAAGTGVLNIDRVDSFDLTCYARPGEIGCATGTSVDFTLASTTTPTDLVIERVERALGAGGRHVVPGPHQRSRRRHDRLHL